MSAAALRHAGKRAARTRLPLTRRGSTLGAAAGEAGYWKEHCSSSTTTRGTSSASSSRHGRESSARDALLAVEQCEVGPGSPSILSEATAGPKFLVTGALGQIGQELVPHLRSRFGAESVVASDVRAPLAGVLRQGPFVQADARDSASLAQAIRDSRATHVLHLASILSASGEQNPQLALDVNLRSVQTVLELARKFKLCVFAPSSIAVFGPSTPKLLTPNQTIMDPTTIYGITKVHLELLGEYYRRTHGVDFRSLRFPGIVSAHTMPGGGTTDYAVDIFHAALRGEDYKCFLRADQRLPMMYVPDCLKATEQLLLAHPQALSESVYNVAAMSFSPEELAQSIARHIPAFSASYAPDFRQQIAETWPWSVSDRKAREDWAWMPSFDLKSMTADMLQILRRRPLATEVEQLEVAL